jgi:hypothetical protein
MQYTFIRERRKEKNEHREKQKRNDNNERISIETRGKSETSSTLKNFELRVKYG